MIIQNKFNKLFAVCCWSSNKNAIDIYKHLGFKEQRVMLEIDL